MKTKTFVFIICMLAVSACFVSCDFNSSTPTYTWTDDGECTAHLAKNGLFTRERTETVQGTCKVVAVADCTNTGLVEYTASFRLRKFSTQVMRVVVPVDPNNHKLGCPTYTWDGTQCTSSAACLNNAEHGPVVATVQATSQTLMDNDCSNVTKYTATFPCGLGTVTVDKYVWTEKQSHTMGGGSVCTTCGYQDWFVVAAGSTSLKPSVNVTQSVVRLPDTGTSYGSKINEQSSIHYMIIPEGYTTLYNSLFDYNTNIYGVSLPSTLTELGEMAFYHCTNLSGSIEIPAGVQSIQRNTFDSCSNLSSVILHTGLKTIGSAAFWGCSNLTYIRIPDGVTSVGISAFGSCTSLKEATLPNTLTTVETKTFSNCTSLAKVTIPSSVRWIRSEAFLNCSSLTDIYYDGTKAQWNAVSKWSDWNKGCPANMTVHCIDD